MATSQKYSGNALITRCDATPALNSFSNAFDAWGIYGRSAGNGNNDMYDDSAGSYPADTFGIIKTGYTESFFAIEDLDNSDNPGGTGRLELDFDVSGLGSLTSIAIDMGAMGDFEAGGGDNTYTFTYQLDGGSETTLFTITPDESIDPYTYTLESGTEAALNDPLTLAPGGSCASSDVLDNDLQTCTAALSGSGNTLTLILTAGPNNGGSEVFVFDHIVINGATGSVNAITLGNVAAMPTFSVAMIALTALVGGAGLIVTLRRKRV